MLIAPNQYPLIRERIAAALISTRDKKTLFVFRQAARHANPHVRLLACLCMGAVGENEATNDLIALVNDENIDVQLAAGMALGAIGTDEALEAMVFALTEGSEQLRQAIAEALAANPEEGHPILFDAITHEDMMLRRAAAFGLRRLKSLWSVTALYRAFLEDEQWYVRSAAQQAFQDIQGYEQRGPRSYPPPQELDWLSAWAAKRGEGIPSGEGGIQLLMNALQEAEPEVRALSAQILGQTGQVMATKALYNALRDRQEEVRTAAHRALSDLEQQIGKPLPALS
jgi:HEAT repeat protein